MRKYIITLLALLLIAFAGLSYAQVTGVAQMGTTGAASNVSPVTMAQPAAAASNASPTTVAAQPAAAAAITPSLIVNNQNLANNSITVASVSSNGPGWVVIHNSINGMMSGIIGLSHVSSGTSRNVVVAIDPTLATANLFAELNKDVGRAGYFDFPTLDTPVMVNGQPVTDTFVISAPGMTLLPSQTTTAAAAQPATVAQPPAPAQAVTTQPAVAPLGSAAATAQPPVTLLGGTASAYASPNAQPIRVGSQVPTTTPAGTLAGPYGLSTQAPSRIGSTTGMNTAPIRVGAAPTAATTGTSGY